MKSIRRLSLLTLLTCFIASLALSASAKTKTEAEYIADLASPKKGVVTDAMLGIERNYPTSTQGIAEIKKMLTDPRPEVRQKAARVLGALHSDVSAEDLKNIAALLKSSNKNEVLDGLKALRGLKAESTVPDILPLLNNPDKNIMRDACRTLAVIGNKSNIPAIEPLLQNPDSAVKKDAQDAIFALKNK